MKKIEYSIFLLLALLMVTACHKDMPKLVIGYIKPSINHIPLTFAISQEPGKSANVEMKGFASGWETQEALAAGKLDMAILPFTYAWTLRSKGYKIKTMACLERETDGIVTSDKIRLPVDLNKSKIGLLRASSLEALMDDYASKSSIIFNPVYFRTPTEMVEALNQGEVDAIVTYVPIIQKLPEDLHVLHWFSDDYPGHPCCNLVVSEQALESKPKQIKQLVVLLESGINIFNSKDKKAVDFVADYFTLTSEKTADAMQHVKYQMYISEQDAAFERSMMQDFIRKDYLTSLPADSEMYYLMKD